MSGYFLGVFRDPAIFQIGVNNTRMLAGAGQKEEPARRCGRATHLVGRIPDDREGIGIVLTGGLAEIGVEPAGTELRG